MALDKKTNKGNCEEAQHEFLLKGDSAQSSHTQPDIICEMEYIYEDAEASDNDDIEISNNTDLSKTDDQYPTQVECPYCHRKYKNKKSLAVHIRGKHRDSFVSHAKMPCQEEACDFRGNRIANLITHLIKIHKKKFQCEKVTFQHQDEFWTWKKDAEERCKSTYSLICASKKSVFGDQKLFLRCSRSGYAKSSNSDPSRVIKRKRGSRKINGVCTSFMSVKFLKEGGAVVNFCRTHYGHKEGDSRIRMNDEERSMIKELIIKGLNASEIIAFMKTRLPLHRHQLLKYVNIRNISVRQNLLLNRNKVEHSEDDWLWDNNRFDHSVKSCDMAMNLNVENEVEIEAGCVSESRIERPFYFSSQEHSSKIQENPQTCTKEELINEVVAKSQKISKLAVGLVSNTSLILLSQKLDSVLNYMNEEDHIQIIPEVETSDNCYQLKQEEHIQIKLENIESSGTCHQIKQKENIQIIPEKSETSGNCYQIKHTFDGAKGNSISLVCSNKDVNELSSVNNEVK